METPGVGVGAHPKSVQATGVAVQRGVAVGGAGVGVRVAVRLGVRVTVGVTVAITKRTVRDPVRQRGQTCCPVLLVITDVPPAESGVTPTTTSFAPATVQMPRWLPLGGTANEAGLLVVWHSVGVL